MITVLATVSNVRGFKPDRERPTNLVQINFMLNIEKIRMVRIFEVILGKPCDAVKMGTSTYILCRSASLHCKLVILNIIFWFHNTQDK
jgi:hypothetical protein